LPMLAIACYGCALRLDSNQNPSHFFVPIFAKHCTSSAPAWGPAAALSRDGSAPPANVASMQRSGIEGARQTFCGQEVAPFVKTANPEIQVKLGALLVGVASVASMQRSGIEGARQTFAGEKWPRFVKAANPER